MIEAFLPQSWLVAPHLALRRRSLKPLRSTRAYFFAFPRTPNGLTGSAGVDGPVDFGGA
jgi:hypothetical protein